LKELQLHNFYRWNTEEFDGVYLIKTFSPWRNLVILILEKLFPFFYFFHMLKPNPVETYIDTKKRWNYHSKTYFTVSCPFGGSCKIKKIKNK